MYVLYIIPYSSKLPHTHTNTMYWHEDILVLPWHRGWGPVSHTQILGRILNSCPLGQEKKRVMKIQGILCEPRRTQCTSTETVDSNKEIVCPSFQVTSPQRPGFPQRPGPHKAPHSKCVLYRLYIKLVLRVRKLLGVSKFVPDNRFNGFDDYAMLYFLFVAPVTLVRVGGD